MEDWDLDGLFTALGQFFALDLGDEDLDPEKVDRISLTDRVTELAIERYNAREEELGEELMGALERFLLLQIIDERWREHLFDMDYLREGIHLRGFAQIDPLVAYKNEAFTLFGDLMSSVWADYTRMIFNVQVNVEERRTAAAAAAGRSDPRVRPGRQLHARGPGLLLRRAERGGRRRDRGSRRGGRDPASGGAAGLRRERRRGRARSAAGGRAAGGRPRARSRPQRPLLVRIGQEVQEVPRLLRSPGADSVEPMPTAPHRIHAPAVGRDTRAAEAARGLSLTRKS